LSTFGIKNTPELLSFILGEKEKIALSSETTTRAAENELWQSFWRPKMQAELAGPISVRMFGSLAVPNPGNPGQFPKCGARALNQSGQKHQAPPLCTLGR